MITSWPSVLWCSFEGDYQCFGDIYYFHLQDSSEGETALLSFIITGKDTISFRQGIYTYIP
jgi:hypothetical protein